MCRSRHYARGQHPAEVDEGDRRLTRQLTSCTNVICGSERSSPRGWRFHFNVLSGDPSVLAHWVSTAFYDRAIEGSHSAYPLKWRKGNFRILQ
jgi:hypothetical protein